MGYKRRFTRHGSHIFILLGWFIAVLSGCSTPLPPQPPLPMLHAQGLVRLDAFSRVEAATSNHSVKSLLAYAPKGTSGITHLLILQNGVLNDATLDDSAAIHAVQAPMCYFLGGVRQVDGESLCDGQEEDSFGIIAFHPDVSASIWPGRLLVSTTALDERYNSPAWSPDGRLFAVAHSKGDEHDIALFAVDASLKNVQQVATLLLPQIPLLLIQWLSWSPGGAWLTFAEGSGHLDTTYGLRISSILAQLATSHGKNKQIAVTNNQLVTLVKYPIIGQAWQPMGSNLVYFDGERLMVVNVTTGQRRKLLAIPDGDICAMTWTPDGHRLIFAHCGSGTADFAPPPAQIYIYTMP